MFNYLNVRVYDDEKTDLLKHWDDTYKYITKAQKEGSKVLVHCKMGVSRSASVVIAYAMKAYNWDFSQAWKHVKDKRNCIKPNNNFLLQLETYQGILDAMKNREKLQRSKSETNLKSPTTTRPGRTKGNIEEREEDKLDTRNGVITETSGVDLKKTGKRPKSWSPYLEVVEIVLPVAPLSQSLESIDKTASTEITREELLRGTNPKQSVDQEPRNVLMPCDNGQSYSVSQNQIVHLPGPDGPSVKHRISKLETQGNRRRGLVLNLTNHFEAAGSKPSSPESSETDSTKPLASPANERIMENGHSMNSLKFQTKEDEAKNDTITDDNSECLVWTASAEAKCTNLNNNRNTSINVGCDLVPSEPTMTMSTNLTPPRSTRRPRRDGDLFSAQLDKVFDREERREPTRESPSRQSSWSSYDSAVVLDNNSVHSSWATLPSRNSSWGSYDMRPSDPLGSSGLFPYDKEEIPWHPGTVKRTKQKLEEGTGASTVKRICTQPNENDEKLQTRLASAPAPIDEVSTDTYNPVLLHYNASPTPQRRESMPSPAEENRLKIETLSVSPVRGIDISPVALTRQIGRLSTSAPVPSVLTTDTDNLPSSLLRACRSESETSSPSVVNTPQCPSVKHYKMVLENLNKPSFSKRCLSVDDSPPEPPCSSACSLSSSSSSSEGPRNVSGIVKNLKKEFEAKSSKFERSLENSSEQSDGQWPRRDSKIIRSLPSSPVIAHSESKIRTSPSVSVTSRDSSSAKIPADDDADSRIRQDSLEDLSVKVLVGKYEVAKPELRKCSEIQLRSHKDRDLNMIEAHPPAKSKIAPQEFARRSVPIMINPSIFLSDSGTEAPGRPPVVPSPSVVVASVVAKAASKKQQQQHGRTHPLARLQVRPRHSSPVYNTM